MRQRNRRGDPSFRLKVSDAATHNRRILLCLVGSAPDARPRRARYRSSAEKDQLRLWFPCPAPLPLLEPKTAPEHRDVAFITHAEREGEKEIRRHARCPCGERFRDTWSNTSTFFSLFFFYDGKDKGRRTGALTAKLRNDKFNFGKRQTFRLTRNRVFAGSKWWKLSLFPKKRCSSVRVRPCLEQPTRWLRRNQKRFINATGS